MTTKPAGTGGVVIAHIEALLAERDHVLVAIDGPCASGKTMLAATVNKRFGGNVLHMDDFFLRPEQRTPERFAQPGGNVDRERFETEVLAPLFAGKTVQYRPWDCHSGDFAVSRTVEPARLTIVEGSYSFHPELARYYDLSVFLDISPETQRSRILERNGPEWGQQFFDRWIPLEQTYFHETDTQGRCTLALKEETR